jgi:hypothetical protein
MDYPCFERRLLRLIFTSNAPLTPVHVAYYLDLPIAEARLYLDQMVDDGALELDSDDAGHIVYSYPLRPPLASLPEPRRPRRRRGRSAEAPPVVEPDAPMRYSPAAAAALSLFLPGVGQIYSGRVGQGVGWLLATGLGYLLFLVPGLILHICCIVNAAAVPAPVHGLALAEPALGLTPSAARRCP